MVGPLVEDCQCLSLKQGSVFHTLSVLFEGRYEIYCFGNDATSYDVARDGKRFVMIPAPSIRGTLSAAGKRTDSLRSDPRFAEENRAEEVVRR